MSRSEPDFDGRPAPQRARRARVRAFTLIEVMLVIGLIALMTGAIIFGSGMLGSSRLRAGATLITSTTRMAISRANATGRPVRMVFDLDKNRIYLEESDVPMLRTKDEDDTTGGAEAVTEAEREATEEASRIMDGPTAPRARFKPVEQFGFDGEEKGSGRELGSGVFFRQVQTEHDDQPVLEGRAYLYFWPGGGTERASIQLYRKGAPDGLTVLVSPLTGRTQLERGRVELEDPGYGAFGEREAD